LASRSRLRALFVSVTLASGAAYAIACGDSGGSGSGSTDTGDGGFTSLPEAAVGPTDAESPATTMRLAHVAPDLGAVDFCYRMATTSSFQGPVLNGGLGSSVKHDAGARDGGDASVGLPDLDAGNRSDGEGGPDAGAASVSYRTVSRYLTLEAAGPLTIALVAPGAASCATPLFVADVTLDPGKLSTVAITSEPKGDGGAAGLALVAFIDDRMTLPNKARVRMIHAALGTSAKRTSTDALSARASGASGAQTVSIADRVEPKKAASPSATVPIDSLGYATLAPVPSPAQLAVGAAASPTASDASIDAWVSDGVELGLRGASLHTGFILTGEGKPSFEVLWCTDTSTSGDRTTCVLVR
jgi:hypothetical protein